MLQRGADGEYERVRALGVAISKSGISIQECAQGHRVAMIMKNLGIAEDDCEDFISKLWRRYVASGLSPDILVEQINQLYFFLEKIENHMLRTTSIPPISGRKVPLLSILISLFAMLVLLSIPNFINATSNVVEGSVDCHNHPPGAIIMCKWS